MRTERGRGKEKFETICMTMKKSRQMMFVAYQFGYSLQGDRCAHESV